jgi:hypothetical protein
LRPCELPGGHQLVAVAQVPASGSATLAARATA